MLSDADRRLLLLEARMWRQLGAKDEAIAVELGLTPTRYAQRLLTLMDDPSAYTEFPMLIKRLRRLRDMRVQARR